MLRSSKIKLTSNILVLHEIHIVHVYIIFNMSAEYSILMKFCVDCGYRQQHVYFWMEETDSDIAKDF